MSIVVQYAGEFPGNISLGNKLFQYCFGRILAEKEGRELISNPISGFPYIEPVGGKLITTDPIRLSGHNYPRFLPEDRQWILEGYFQQYEYYKPYKKEVKDWCWNKGLTLPKNDKDMVLHYRMGDYKSHHSILNPDFCVDVIRQERFDRLYIVTDGPNSIPSVFKQFDPIIWSSDYLEDFYFIESFDKIFISQSTFSWWAAWLSDAKRILFPKPKNGYWSGQRKEIRLWIDDEPRYVLVEE